MYSTKIIEMNVEKVEASLGYKLKRHSLGEIDSWIKRLNGLLTNKGELSRSLTSEEEKFIENEVVLYRLDYHYASRNYHYIQLDGVEGGGVKRAKKWKSQEILLDCIAGIEEENDLKKKEGHPVDGILVVAHKSRQLGLTAEARKINIHRITSVKYTRALAGSIDDDKVQELYDRDKLILDNLPWWLKLGYDYDVKGLHISLKKLNSKILYQTSTQKSGVGQGRQFDISHLTECADWPDSETIENDFFPTIPQSTASLCILESTAQGRGNWWHDIVTRIQEGGSIAWNLVFIPWYAEKNKYNRQPPESWHPSEITSAHAQKVYETSFAYVGERVMLTKQKLYWWETQRNEHQKNGTLNLFLANWCATVEESFQHSTSSAFSPELLEKLRNTATVPPVYEVIDA